MEVIKAKTAGFCFGVKRAVDTVYEQVSTCDGPIYTYGPIIHNEEVVKDLESKGVIVLRTEEALDEITKGTPFPRSRKADLRQAGEKRDPDRRCDMSICKKDPQYCAKRECRRKVYSDHR